MKPHAHAWAHKHIKLTFFLFSQNAMFMSTPKHTHALTHSCACIYTPNMCTQAHTSTDAPPPTYSINYTHRHMHMHTQYKHFQKSAAPFLLIHTSACKVAAVFKLLTVNLEMSIIHHPRTTGWSHSLFGWTARTRHCVSLSITPSHCAVKALLFAETVTLCLCSQQMKELTLLCKH